MEPIYCGGNNDEWIQEREQWHSGANFFAIGPGKIIGYDRNESTIEEINKNGFEVIKAKDIINNKVKINKYDKFVITIDGTELSSRRRRMQMYDYAGKQEGIIIWQSIYL